jgi:hypothetical protein
MPVRWSSTFVMLERAESQRKVSTPTLILIILITYNDTVYQYIHLRNGSEGAGLEKA